MHLFKAGLNPGFSSWVGLEILTNCGTWKIYNKKIIVFMYITKTSITGAKYVTWANSQSQNLFLADSRNITRLRWTDWPTDKTTHRIGKRHQCNSSSCSIGNFGQIFSIGCFIIFTFDHNFASISFGAHCHTIFKYVIFLAVWQV